MGVAGGRQVVGGGWWCAGRLKVVVGIYMSRQAKQ